MKTKKIINYIIFTLLISISVVFAKTEGDLHFCEYPGTVRLMKILGLLLLIAKILVPIIIIGVSCVEFGKAVANSDSGDAVKKAATTLIKRLIIGIVILAIPTLIRELFNTLAPVEASDKFKPCETCIFTPNKCDIPTTDPVITK